MQNIYNLIIISHDEDNAPILDTHSYEYLNDAQSAFLEVCEKWKDDKEGDAQTDFLAEGYGYVQFTNGRHIFLRKEPLLKSQANSQHGRPVGT